MTQEREQAARTETGTRALRLIQNVQIVVIRIALLLILEIEKRAALARRSSKDER